MADDKNQGFRRAMAAAMMAGAGAPATAGAVLAEIPREARAAPPRRSGGGGGQSGGKALITRAAEQASALAQKLAPAAAVLSQPITPQERALAFLDTQLRGPLSLKEAQAVIGMLPAPQKRVSTQEQLLGDASAFAKGLYDAQLRQIAQEPDPATQQEQFQSASKELLDRLIALNRGNPMNLAGAGLLGLTDGGS